MERKRCHLRESFLFKNISQHWNHGKQEKLVQVSCVCSTTPLIHPAIHIDDHFRFPDCSDFAIYIHTRTPLSPACRTRISSNTPTAPTQMHFAPCITSLVSMFFDPSIQAPSDRAHIPILSFAVANLKPIIFHVHREAAYRCSHAAEPPAVQVRKEGT